MGHPFAVNLDLEGRPVLVVGGGTVAARKVDGLRRAGAHVTVVAPEAVPDIADDPDVRWFPRPYQRGELASYRLGVTATDDPDVNALVATDGERAGVFVNAADDPENCSFTLPSIARAGDLQVAVSTNGRSPALSAWLRRRIEREIAAGHDQLLDLLAEARDEARAAFGTSEIDGWDAALDDGLLELVRAGRIEAARATLRAHLGLTADVAPSEDGAMTVHLVGAGPGDPDLLTVRAVRLLERADVVVHDRLVDPSVLELVPVWAERIDVGKRPGDPAEAQRAINDLLVDRGRRHDCVVRLKGGDPFVFGRGGEEAAALVAAGVDVEMVPGITSAIAAPAAAGIPVTQRGISSGFTVVTAHQDPTTDRWLDWDALAASRTTLVILMGARRAAAIATRLRAGGMDPATPVAIVHAATTAAQQVARTTLADLPSVTVPAPATIVVGAVAAHTVLPTEDLAPAVTELMQHLSGGRS